MRGSFLKLLARQCTPRGRSEKHSSFIRTIPSVRGSHPFKVPPPKRPARRTRRTALPNFPVADYTAGGELHPAPKNRFEFAVIILPPHPFVNRLQSGKRRFCFPSAQPASPCRFPPRRKSAFSSLSNPKKPNRRRDLRRQTFGFPVQGIPPRFFAKTRESF